MRHHPVIDTALVAGAAAALAFVAGILAAIVGLGVFGASVAAGLVLAVAFAWRPVDGLLAFGLATLLADSVEYWSPADFRFLDEAAIPLLITVTLLRQRSRRSLPALGWREAALGTMFLAGIVSSLVNAVPVSIWGPGIALLAKGFAFFYLVLAQRIDEDALRRIGGGALVIGGVVIAIGFIEFLAPELADAFLGVYPYEQQRGSVEVVNSWFTHPALYGWLAAFLSLGLLARFAVLREAWALVLGILVGGASILSGRRTPVVSLVLSLVAGAIRQAASRRVSWRAWAAVGAGALLVAVITIPAMGGFYQSTFRDYFGRPGRIAEVFAEEPRGARIMRLHPRVALYAGSVAIARDEFPLGVGIGRYGSHMSREEYSPVYREYKLHRVYGLRERRPIAVTDTFWPMILGETGTIGLLAALAFFGLLVRDLWRAALPIGPPTVRVFTLAALMVFVEALLRSSASAVFVAPPVAYWAFGAAGLALAARRSERVPEDAAEDAAKDAAPV